MKKYFKHLSLQLSSHNAETFIWKHIDGWIQDLTLNLCVIITKIDNFSFILNPSVHAALTLTLTTIWLTLSLTSCQIIPCH